MASPRVAGCGAQVSASSAVPEDNCTNTSWNSAGMTVRLRTANAARTPAAPSRTEGRLVAAIRALAALELAQLFGLDRLHRFLRERDCLDDLAVQDQHAAGGDRAEGVLLVSGHAELADEGRRRAARKAPAPPQTGPVTEERPWRSDTSSGGFGSTFHGVDTTVPVGRKQTGSRASITRAAELPRRVGRARRAGRAPLAVDEARQARRLRAMRLSISARCARATLRATALTERHSRAAGNNGRSAN